VNGTKYRILCADIGTSSIKAAILDEEGAITSWRHEPLISTRHENYLGWDAEIWDTAVARIVKSISKEQVITHIAVSGNGPSLVPIGKDGNQVAPILFWMDKKNDPIDNEPSFFLPKIAWLKNNKPKVYEETKTFLACPEYVCYSLTGEKATVLPTEDYRPFYWTKDGLEAYGIDERVLPPYISIGTPYGTLSADKAEEFGVSPGIPVYACGPDFLMALLGTAAVRPGVVCDRAGSSEGINYCSAEHIKAEGLRTLPHIIPGLWNVAAIEPNSGRLFEWFRAITGQENRSYEHMFREIMKIPPESEGPFFFPRFQPHGGWQFAGGVLFGIDVEHDAARLGKAVVESIGFSVRNGCDRLVQAGCSFNELRVSGGQARNNSWNQLKADLTGNIVHVPQVEDSELLGCGCVVLTGQSYFSGLVEAAETMFQNKQLFKPDINNSAVYDSMYKRYIESYRIMIQAAGECSNIKKEEDDGNKNSV